MSSQLNKNLKVGVISDGKYGERAFQNIQKKFETEWIIVPDIPSNVMLDDELDLNIPECDVYISYVRHPDIIIELTELQKPLILGVLPGIGLYQQAKQLNSNVVYAPTMCSLDCNTGIPKIDEFTSFFGKPIYETEVDKEGIFRNIKAHRTSLCGSSEAGAKFLLNKEFNPENLQNFALSICHECRAPRFGHTCDKEVAGIIHLISLLEGIPLEMLTSLDEEMKSFIENTKNEYMRRSENSRLVINQVR